MDKIKDKIKKALSEVLEIEVAQISDSDDFITDLGMDSMSALEFVDKVEREFRVVIPEEQFFELTDIAKVEGLLKSLIK